MTDAVGLLWPRRRLSRALTTLAALCWSLVLAAVASAQVTASVDRTTISIDEVVTLQLELDPSVGRANVGQPEGEDFTVVGTSTYRGTTVVNGRRASSSTVSISCARCESESCRSAEWRCRRRRVRPAPSRSRSR